jgi:nitrite reductase/ring-hydroxylating ferredoxin subunit
LQKVHADGIQPMGRLAPDRAFFATLRGMSEVKFRALLPLNALKEGAMSACTVADREILVCRTREGLFAVDNICTHAEARMSEGRLKGVRVICPLHGASFDVRDGHVLAGPATQPLPTYETRVVDGTIEVATEPRVRTAAESR